MKKHITLVTSLCVWCCLAPAALAFSISRTETHTLQSESNQKTYEIYVRTPGNYTEPSVPQRRFPVVLVNDATWAFPTASGISDLLVGNDMAAFILVGISYSSGDDKGVSRTRDYTPSFAPDETSFHSVAAKQVSGNAAQYLEFIDRQVFPLLDKHYRISPNKRVFVGHSFGGLLGAYTLITRPELFSDYIIGSPSLWYDNKVIFKLEADYAKRHKTLPARAFMFVGDSENQYHAMTQDLENFAARLQARNYAGLTLYKQVIQDASHHSAFAHLLTRALPMALPKNEI